MDGGIRSQDVVVGEQMTKPQLLDPLTVGANRARVRADLGLRENDSGLHVAPA
jgi:hypothetical protein